ncbi:MAG: hypothetical protein ACLFQ3_09730 [Thiohalorhabdus sp.]
MDPRLQAVKKVLRKAPDVATWCSDFLLFEAEDLTTESVRDFGGDGHGYEADYLLVVGTVRGILAPEEFDNALPLEDPDGTP